MTAFLSTVILLAGLTQASGGVVSQSSEYQVSTSSAPVVISQQTANVPVGAGVAVTSGDTLIGALTLPEQAQDNVLVVPTPDLPPESAADLTEDLSVMCRIFDKSLPSPRAAAETYGLYGGAVRPFRLTTGRQSRETQGLYLDGYGALFFVHVGYPLVPTGPQEQAPPKAAEPADSVWSQTVKEMSGQPGEEQQTTRNEQKYDAQKVENLKRTLIKTLAHASNIRMRRPQDVITLVVGALDDDRSWRRWGQPGTRIATNKSRGTAGQPVAPAPRVASTSPAALLVVRVTKADVDAFAKNQLTLAQFTEKVQVLSLPTGPSAPEASAAGPTPVNSSR